MFSCEDLVKSAFPHCICQDVVEGGGGSKINSFLAKFKASSIHCQMKF